jgi:hypothetical protein
MAEMDGYWNPYSAYNADGSSRGAAHSTTAFKRAWKRVTLIFRGGSVSSIDAELAKLGDAGAPCQRGLARGKVAMLWLLQVSGSPAVPGNQPHAYWPGRRWVDWVGTDFYGKFPNFSGLSTFYSEFPGEPFVFGEYALWGSDDPGFINQLFGWIGSHSRTRMLIYNQGQLTNGPLRLKHYPNGAAALRHHLASSKFPAFAPEWR